MRRLQIYHETLYELTSVVQLGLHQLIIRPREGHDLRIESWWLEISPRHRIKWHRDAHDNSVASVTFNEPTQHLKVASTVVIQHFDEAPLDFLVADYAVQYPFSYTADDLAILAPYLEPTDAQAGGPLRTWLTGFWLPGIRIQTYVLLESLCRGIANGLNYRVREEPGVQSPSQTLSSGGGSCRDFAAMFMEAARALGLAARFVSGYLHGAEAGMGATHAWAEVYLPGAGWKGFDPTIGKLTGSDHIPVAVARRPEAVPPVAGTFTGPSGASARMLVTVNVLSL